MTLVSGGGFTPVNPVLPVFAFGGQGFPIGTTIPETVGIAKTLSAANYTYLTTDLVTGTVLGEIPFQGVSMSAGLSTAGSFQGLINLDDPTFQNLDMLQRTTPGRTALWVYRRDPSQAYAQKSIVWGGIIWTRAYSAGSGTALKEVTITGQTFESYAARRFPRSFLGTRVQAYSGVPQCTIINDLWERMQGPILDINGKPVGFVGSIRVDGDPNVPRANDTPVTMAVNGWDLSFTVHDYIQGILDQDNGPDYTIRWIDQSDGAPRAQLVVAPFIGDQLDAKDTVIDYPGSIINFLFTEDATQGANWWWAQSTSATTTGPKNPTGLASSVNRLKQGWPIIESLSSGQVSTTVQTVEPPQNAANAALTTFPMPYPTWVIELKANRPPVFGTYGLGDYILVNIQDARFQRGIQLSLRIVGWTVIPADSVNDVELVQLVVMGTPGNVSLMEQTLSGTG